MGRPTPRSVRERLKPWLVGRENADGEARGYCPICEEPGESTSPSASFNFGQGIFTCFSQCGGMSIPALVKMMKEDGDFKKYEKKPEWLGDKKKPTNIQDAPSNRAAGKLPSEDRIEEMVEKLLSNRPILDRFKDKRGYTNETIKRFQIGWDGRRYTFPVRDADGTLVNVRRYKLNAKEPKDKMRSWARGTGQRRLFLPYVVENNETVIITEGEPDALIGQQNGLPAMSHTGGAANWDVRWNEMFEDKIVYICYDCDEAGRRGAQMVARHLEMFAKEVHIIDLPLKGKGDDLTNYFVDQEYDLKDFKELMKKARTRVTKSSKLAELVQADPDQVTLEDTMNSQLHGRPVKFSATVAGKVNPPYFLPQRVEANCNEGGGSRCERCPISGRNHREVDIPSHDPILLDLVDVAKDKRRQNLLRYMSIPHTCPDVEVEESSIQSVEELVLIPPVDEHWGSSNAMMDRRIYNVGPHNTPVNQKVQFTGMSNVGAKDGRSVLLGWDSKPTSADIDQFTMNEETFNVLTAFWPDEDQTPLNKMHEIVADLEANVTRIFYRPELHMAYDLVWHSVLDFDFKGQRLGKGWLELLVIGDTRTGKSEAAKRMCEHYRAGVLTTCEGATFAGLVGGVQQMASTWVVSWGTIPINDRRLVILDEFGGLAEKGIIEQMSSVRSSGVAQINKIRSSETMARTRLVWIANPVDGSTVESFANGAMEAIKGLANNPEDIARFDFAMSVASSEVTAQQINASKPPQITHRYTSKLCGMLVNWAWSRKPDQIVWEQGVENYVLQRARRLGESYITEPPLIQVENVRLKLARMAVAVAARLFSTDDTGELVIVGKEHVEAAEELLNKFYGMESFGYREYSRKVLAQRKEAEANVKSMRNYLLTNEDVFETLKTCIAGPFKMRDFIEFGGMSQLEAQNVVRDLQKYGAIRRLTKGYIRAEPALAALVRNLERDK